MGRGSSTNLGGPGWGTIFERRRFGRHPGERRAIALGWWQGDEFRTAEALLLDLSLGGAAAMAEAAPEAGSALWFRLEPPGPTDWVESVVTAADATTNGVRLVRLKFRGPCPYDIFRAAIRLDGPGGSMGTASARPAAFASTVTRTAP